MIKQSPFPKCLFSSDVFVTVASLLVKLAINSQLIIFFRFVIKVVKVSGWDHEDVSELK